MPPVDDTAPQAVTYADRDPLDAMHVDEIRMQLNLSRKAAALVAINAPVTAIRKPPPALAVILTLVQSVPSLN